MSICINSSTPCILPIAKNTPYFGILPLIFTIAKNYSLVLNFTPYFHEQGVNYSFGKTLARALYMYINNYDNLNLSSVSAVILDEALQEASFTTSSHLLDQLCLPS